MLFRSELIIVLGGYTFAPQLATTVAQKTPDIATRTNTAALGDILYTDYLYYFQIAGLVLLVAMIGAIVLTLRSRPGVRRQKVSEQLYRPKDQTITVVKVPTRGGV